jgi:hypothetical protein
MSGQVALPEELTNSNHAETENEWVVDDDETLFSTQGKTPNIPLLIDRFRLCCMKIHID